MGKPYVSIKKTKVEPSKRDPEYVLAEKWFRGVVQEQSSWNQEELKHLYDVKEIPINQLYTVRNKTPYKAIQSETEKHQNMRDYEPINVIKQNKKYIVISGNERVIALAARGYKKIKARVYEVDRKK